MHPYHSHKASLTKIWHVAYLKHVESLFGFCAQSSLMWPGYFAVCHHGFTRPQWVNLSSQISRNIMLGNWPFLWWIASQQNTLHKISLMLGLCFPQRMITWVHLWINSMHTNWWGNYHFWLMFPHDYFFHIFMKPDQFWHPTKTLL